MSDAALELTHRLREYALHAPACSYSPSYPEGDVATCDCGFDAVLDDYDRVAAGFPLAEHPERHCQRCGDRNPVWHAPNPLWNEIMRGPDELEARWGIVCPRCFAELAESKGIGTKASWRWEPATYPSKEDTDD